MNLRKIDLNLLVVLEAILSEQSVSKAARRMHLSQSALSHGLSRLRQVLDDPLLLRIGQRMELTPRAQSLLPEVQHILSQVEGLIGKSQKFSPGQIDRLVHIGASDLVAQGILSVLVSKLNQLAPALRLHIHHSGRVNAPEQLRSGKLDLALGIFPLTTIDIEVLQLTEEPYLCVRRGSVSEKAPDLDAYLAATHVNVLVQGGTLGGVDAVLAKQGLKREILVTVAHFHAALAMVAESSHWFTGPRSLVLEGARRMGLHTFAPPITIPPFVTQMAWSIRSREDACLSWLRELLITSTHTSSAEDQVSATTPTLSSLVVSS